MNAISLVLLSLLAQVGAPPATPEAREQARPLLKEGARHYLEGEFQQALEKFTEAYKIFPSPKLLFNIGQANRELDRPVDAVEAFERFLAQSPEGVPELVTEAKRSLAELAPRIGRLRIECPLSGAEISIDGKPVGRAPLADSIPVMPGNHEVKVIHPNAAPDVKGVTVAPGAVETVAIRPKPSVEIDVASPWPVSAPPVPPRLAEVAAKPAEPTPSAETGWWLGRKWTWVAAGSTVVFATGAIIAGTMMQYKFDDLRSSCGRSAGPNWNGCSSSDISSLDARKDAANVFWGLTAAAAVATGVLFYVEGRQVAVAPIAGESTGILARVRY
jgi:hypothetical protein